LPIALLPGYLDIEIEDSSAIDPSLATAAANPPPPKPGTSYAGLTPAQRFAFITWSRTPQGPAPVAFQQLYVANLEVRLLESTVRPAAIETLHELGSAAAWANNVAIHRAYLLSCWLEQDGERLAGWIGIHSMPPDLLGVALGMQALMSAPLTALELGAAIAAWQLGALPAAELLKLRLDSLAAILRQPPLDFALSQLEAAATPLPWRTSHRGLRLLIPQPDLRPVLEPSLRDLLAVADVDDEEPAPASNLGVVMTSRSDTADEQDDLPSLEELGWRLILEFGSNRSDYFNYVLSQAQKLPGYSQLMDEDRRIVYRVIFRKSEMRRFWRLWDYVNGWTSTRVYLNGVELEKWKVWPYSQYLR
jgi:hypothetical protein